MTDRSTSAPDAQSGTRARVQWVALPREANAHRPPRRILIAAYRSDEEPRRLTRLRRVAVRALQRGQPVAALYDYKGQLSATFERRPTPADIGQLYELWAGENEGIIDAVYHGRTLVLGDDYACGWPW